VTPVLQCISSSLSSLLSSSAVHLHRYKRSMCWLVKAGTERLEPRESRNRLKRFLLSHKHIVLTTKSDCPYHTTGYRVWKNRLKEISCDLVLRKHNRSRLWAVRVGFCPPCTRRTYPKRSPFQTTRPGRVCVECLIGKQKKPILFQGHRAEFHTVQSSFRVRQNGGVPGPPTRNPSSRIHRCPSGLPTALQEN
jgi:hypothetical protein